MKNIIFEEFGFTGMSDFLKTVMGAKHKIFLFMEGITAFIALLSYFIEVWVWTPPQAAYFILVLLIIESITGTAVARNVKKEKFNIKKFYRTFPILVSHVLILSICHNIAKFEPLLSWMPNAAFSWFTTRTAMSIFIDLADLKLVNGDFVKFIRSKIIKTESKDNA